MTNPLEVKKVNEFLLFTKWSDGFESTIKLEDLRKDCPCAECTGEKIGDIIYSKPKPVRFEPGVYEIKELTPIGNYAIAAKWANGHDTGIYTWELLRKIFDKYSLTQSEINEITSTKKKDKRNINLNVIS
ncbi:DUF971 domain-containing protein [Candidatus Kapabacteria bacterium]|nr:DUF971 domain-containing protein [Candidatus Kapabacteria bacterium]